MAEQDGDYMLALQLQQQFDNEEYSDQEEPNDLSWNHGRCVQNSPTKLVKSPKCDNLDTSVMSLVDPRWELIDPLPDIRALFLEFNDKYFWGRLSGIEVKWSGRMTLCAGLCVYEGRGGLCSVRLSGPLLKLRPRKDLVETLLHEMIHAYLFVTDNNKDHDGHGPEFHKHMHRLNKSTGTNISVYHTFRDEVDNYRQHWWRCNGPCQRQPPYFGYVKRSMNRAPSAQDPWWPSHQQTCGGTYTKVKEPEGYGVKKRVARQEKKIVKPKGNLDIRLFSSGNTGAGANCKTSASSTVTKPGNSAQNDETRQHTHIVNGVLKTLTGARTTSGNHDFHETVTKNVEGVRGRDRQGNVHGFDEFHGKSSQTSSPSKRKAFSGAGTTLGETKSPNSNNNRAVGPVIRKIPGLGTIYSERYLANSANNASRVLDSVKPAESEPTNKDENVNVNKQQPLIDYNSEDSEFDDFLDSLVKTVFQKKKKKKNTKPGFVSVCSKNSRVMKLAKPVTETTLNHSHSGRSLGDVSRRRALSEVTDKNKWGIQTKQVPLHSATVSESQHNSSRTGSSKGVEKSHINVIPKHNAECSRRSIGTSQNKLSADFAMGRNKRALDRVSSDSDSDIDENVVLGSVIRQKVKSPTEHTMKRLRLTDDTTQNLCATTHKENASVSFDQDITAFSDSSIQQEPAASNVPNTEFVSCPVCQTRMKEIYINEHLDTCLS